MMWSSYLITHVCYVFGVLALVCANGKLFCIGGCVGQRSVPDCHVFDPEKKSWSDIAPLTKG